MSYSINYAPSAPKSATGRWFGKIGAAVIVITCALAAGFGIPQMSQQLRHNLFPWTQPVVQQAFSEFCGDIGDGESVREALTDFCLVILRSGEET